MSSGKQKAIAVALGILAAAVLLEISLAVLSIFQERRADWEGQHGAEQRVLCLGDSFVFGKGAPPEKSFPAQLEELLNAGRAKKTFRVINAGVQGQNTSQMLATLPRTLAEARPRIVVLLSGGANDWNYSGYYRYREGNVLLAFLGEAISRVRVYKLAKLLYMRMNTVPSQEKIRWDRASLEVIEYNRDAQRFLDAGDDQAALRTFTELTRIDASNPENHHNAALVYIRMNKWKEALEALKTGVHAAPEDENNANYGCLVYLYRLTHGLGDLQIRKEIQSFLRDLRKNRRVRNPTLDGVLDMLDNPQKESASEKVVRWIEHDLRTIIDTCRSGKIDVVLADYPEDNGVNAVLARTAKICAVPFANVSSIFGELFLTHRRDEFLISDGHCNPKGYRVIAETVYRELKEQGYISD